MMINTVTEIRPTGKKSAAKVTNCTGQGLGLSAWPGICDHDMSNLWGGEEILDLDLTLSISL